MVIVPDSKITLIKNPLKLDSNNEMMFESATAQYNYFNSLPKLEYTGMTYIRKDDVVRIQTKDSTHLTAPTFEDLLQYNFCMYQNTHFSNKWFYAYITDIKWINPSLTEIKIETAYFQTWQFDLVYMDSFIEREHVDDDTIGKHTLSEDVELGDPVQCNDQDNINVFNTFWVCVGMTELPDAFTSINTNRMYNGIYSGLTYIVFKTSTDLSTWLEVCDKAGKADAINCMFMIPSELCKNPSWIQGSTTIGGVTYYYDFTWIENSTTAEVLIASNVFTRPTYIAYDYSPKNNKLYTYPYFYFYVTNNCGSDVIYRYEDFLNGHPTFAVLGSITPGCSVKLIPKNYKLADDISTTYNSYNYGLSAGKLPICSWNSDVYTNWLTSQCANLTLGQVRDEINIVGSLATGDIRGVLGGFDNIIDRIGEKYQHSLIPNQARGNVNSGDVTFSAGMLKFTIYYMSIRKEYAKIIDDFFSLFGYKVNRVGTPHLHVRQYYDYCKTNGINLEGNIPENDLNKIREMFNKGIRLWHSTSNYLDFSVTNSII